MPEEIFDILEEVFDSASERRKKNRKRAQRRAREQGYEEPERRSSGGLLGRFTSFFQPSPPPRQQPQQQAKPEPGPSAELEAAYRNQLRLLDDLRRSVSEVSDAQRSMQARADRNQQRMADYEAEARRQLAAGHEELARVALERRRLGEAQAAEFERELASLRKEHAQLLRAEARLEAKIETFRTRRDMLRSQRASAEAQARISEAYGGLSEESSDVAYTVRRIESHTRELRSRGAAADQMLDDGLVEGIEDAGTRFNRKLALSEVDDDLERLRRELDEEAGGT